MDHDQETFIKGVKAVQPQLLGRLTPNEFKIKYWNFTSSKIKDQNLSIIKKNFFLYSHQQSRNILFQTGNLVFF